MFFLAVNSILPDTSTNRTQNYYKKMKRARFFPEIITQNTFFNNPVQKKTPKNESCPAAQTQPTRAIARATIPYYNI